jgi:hypothetical protein
MDRSTKPERRSGLSEFPAPSRTEELIRIIESLG